MVDLLMRELDGMLDSHSVRVILDIGSRDALEAIALKDHFPEATVYAFECNPPAIERCVENIGTREDVILIPKAVSDECGTVEFHAIDPERTITTWPDGNIGASSLFVANPAYPNETYFQNKITVEAVTLEQWAADAGVSTIDIIWMDLQGAGLKALVGLGDLIDTVKIIYTEVEYKEVYLGVPLFPEIDEYLRSRGFHLHAKFNTSEWFGDAMYVRNDLTAPSPNDPIPRNQKQVAWLEALTCLDKEQGIIALETGRIRNPEWKDSDGSSTDFLSGLHCVSTLISVDDDSENFSGYETTREYCEEVLSEAQLKKIVFLDGDSANVISNEIGDEVILDFVLLDSANDPETTFQEFLAVARFLNEKRAVVVIDDVSPPGQKGDKLIPYLVDLGFEEHRRKVHQYDCSFFVLTHFDPGEV